MNFKSNNLILLTGAGFTKNFGGFLADDMWDMILGHPLIQKNEKLKRLVLSNSNFDYETIYDTVLSSNKFNDDEKSAMKKVIEQVYKDLDDAIRGRVYNSENPRKIENGSQFHKFIRFFVGGAGEKGFFFTLNHDLFMERQFKYRAPMVPFFNEEFHIFNQEFSNNHLRKLPNQEELETQKENLINSGDLLYIKLHGSYGWLSINGENQMVIGGGKEKIIKKEPLLKWYFSIFKEVIRQDDKKIVIIGYGFREEHINKILMEGIRSHNLKIYVITKMEKEDLKRRLNENGAFLIWESLCGYSCGSLEEIFPWDSETADFKKIERFFNN